ncbi:hypothetical protein ACISO4_001563 [Escherichia coli]
MPVVPTTSGRQVQSRGISTQGFSSFQTPNVGDVLGDVAEQYAGIIAQAKQRANYSAAIFLIPICISFDTAEKRRYATYLILNRRFSFEF